MEGAQHPIELFHGYTYSGHPLACAAGLAALDLYRDEALFARAAELSGYWRDALHALADAPFVIDVRTIGLMAGIELQPRPGAPTARAMEVFEAAFDKGVLIRVTGDIIALSPPLIIDNAQIDRIVDTVREALAKIG
jgi:beta-alanine--pyruvate transaminase